MMRRTRRMLFYGLFAVFLFVGTAVVYYAQGWRFDFATWRAEKVGAIFVRTFPKDADIFLDKTPVKNRAGLLTRGAFLSDLFPKNYKLVLKKDGYADWHENVEVFPSLVTELKYAVLVPQRGTVVATGTVKRFAVISGEMITERADGAVVWRGKTNEKTIGRGVIVSGSTDLKTIVMKSAASGSYFLYSFDRATSTNLSAALARIGVNSQNIANVAIDPYDGTKVIIMGIRRAWIFDTVASTAPSLIEKSPARETLGPSLAASQSFIAWTRFRTTSGTSKSGSSTIVLYDKFSKALIESSSTVAGRNLKLAWVNGGTLGVLQADGSLYRYDTGADRFQKLADDVKNFQAADDGARIAALERKNLEIFSLTDAETYHRFNLPNIGNAENIIWYYDLNHLFVIYPEHVSFLDLRDLGLNNFTTAARGTAPFYDSKANALYLINPERALVRFDFPT